MPNEIDRRRRPAADARHARHTRWISEPRGAGSVVERGSADERRSVRERQGVGTSDERKEIRRGGQQAAWSRDSRARLRGHHDGLPQHDRELTPDGADAVEPARGGMPRAGRLGLVVPPVLSRRRRRLDLAPHPGGGAGLQGKRDRSDREADPSDEGKHGRDKFAPNPAGRQRRPVESVSDRRSRPHRRRSWERSSRGSTR